METFSAVRFWFNFIRCNKKGEEKKKGQIDPIKRTNKSFIKMLQGRKEEYGRR
uniref:Uncharacterized protein n=1 Tax=Loa loa TaxID=7209 RepID=A0A1I7V9D3_LOALO